MKDKFTRDYGAFKHIEGEIGTTTFLPLNTKIVG